MFFIVYFYDENGFTVFRFGMVPRAGYKASTIVLKLFNRLLSGFSISFVYLLYFETKKIIVKSMFSKLYEKKTNLYIISYFTAITTI